MNLPSADHDRLW